jgi:beta propeller repeat protein
MLKENYKFGCVNIGNCHSFFLCLFTYLTLVGISPINLQANPTIEELTLRMESAEYWNSQGLNLQTETEIVNEGDASVSMDGYGYQTFESIPLNTENIQNVTDTLLLDFYIGDNQPNPWWIGQVLFFAECPSANIHNQFVDHFELTGYEMGTWHTFALSLPANVAEALNGNHDDFIFRFALNVNYGSGPYYMDNIRFSGDFSFVVWYGRGGSDGGNDYEIFFWNKSSIQQITENDGYEYSPQISGNNVVWHGQGGGGGSDYEIFLWNGSSIQQITENDNDDYSPQISGNNVVWYGYRGNGSDIFFWNGSSMQQITENDGYDYSPQISGNNVVWNGQGGSDGGSDYEIFFWNGSSIQQITENDGYDYSPQISGNNIVWYGYGGSDGGIDSEIFFWNGSSIQQITENDRYDYSPQISGNNVVWYGDGGGDSEIFFWNGSSIQQITENDDYDYFPQISGNNVVWNGHGGIDGGSDSEIFFWNGSTIQQITENDDDDKRPQISR